MIPTRPILVTGFEPFASHGRNPSQEAVRLLSGMDLIIKILPVEYSAAELRLKQLIQSLNPRVWIGFGLHQKTPAITLERLAVNMDDASIPDNAGDLRRGVPINPTGPDHYRSTLPLDTIEKHLLSANIPVISSDNAGRFVCNHIFYSGVGVLQHLHSDALAGFIHLPWPTDWLSAAPPIHTVTFETIVRAVRVCVACVAAPAPADE